MAEFLVALIGGAALGGTYALISLGLVLAFRATETFNFAHGEMMLLPAFILGYLQLHTRFAFALAALITLAAAAVLGLLFYVLVLRHLVGKPVFMSMIATLGLGIVLDAVMTMWFGSNEYTLKIPALPTGVTTVFGARISSQSLVLAGCTIALALLVTIVMRFTRLGTRVRAAGQDPVLASQGGIHVNRIYLVTWALVAVLAGVAGIAYGAVTLVDTSITGLGLASIPAILLGGLDSIEGALVGGLLVGVLQGFTSAYVGADYLDPVTYGLLLVVLLVRPQGLFGTEHVVRV